jgi:UTP--glucose-1-phosphate uridylyltransferase
MTITDAVVPVAGLGTRLLPATKSQPKEMLPLVDRPVVQYVVEELARVGIERVLFVTGRRKRAIEDHFDSDPELEAALGSAVPGPGLEIFYTRQPAPRGLGDALRYAATFAAGRPVVVALGDTVVTGPDVLPALIEHDADAVLAVEEVAAEDVSRYGIVAPAESVAEGPFAVADVVEKPTAAEAPSRWAVAARYVLGPTVFDALARTEADERGEVQLADALRLVLADGGRVLAVPLDPGGRRYDVGTLTGYCTAFLELALRDERVAPALRSILEAL